MKKLKKDNRGVSLVMVIAAIALVTVLVTVALTMGLWNYQMKATNRISKNNFYDAERVLDEIRLGLQSDVSDAMSQAYVETMADYTGKSTAKRTKHFNETYIKVLRSKLAQSSDENHYNVDYLLNFLDQKVKERTSLTTVEGKTPQLSVSESGLTLKNLFLTYTNEQDYETRVQTDIQILFPQMNFTESGSFPNVLKYALIAQKGASLEKTSNVTVDGSIYGGGDDASLSVGNGVNLLVEKGNDVILKNKLCLEQGSEFSGETKVTLWSNDIEAANASKLSLKGTTYTANDLTLFGSADVQIGGEYYGFGNPKAALKADSNQSAKIRKDIEDNPSDYSSAIIVNAIGSSVNGSSAKARLNLGQSTTLMLAGNAYIGNSTVFMGESLTVKSNQIAYLVPESCMDGMANPMTEQMHIQALTNTGGDTPTNQAVLLKSHILSRVQALTPGVSGIEEMTQGNLYYYYMRFESAKAASDYFTSYYGSAASAKIKNYLDLYVDQKAVQINRNAKKDLNGNILVYDAMGITSIGDTITEGSDLSDSKQMSDQLVSYQDMFHSNNINLTLNYEALSGVQKSRTVFENLVKDKLFDVVGTSGWFTYKEGGTSYAAYVTDNTSQKLVIDDTFLGKAPSGAKIRMVIATGDVEVRTDFEGTILSKGKVTVSPSKANITLCKNQNQLAKLIAGGTCQKSGKDYLLKDYLTDSEKYLGREVEMVSSDNRIRLEQLVVYTNWSKK